LLSGKVPFPGGSLTEKLLKHQLHEPTPVERIRSEVPPLLAGIVRKLMAKKPEGRYQTPEEVVAALAAVLSARDGEDWTIADGGPLPAAQPSPDTFASPFAHLEASGTAQRGQAPAGASRQRKEGWRGVAGVAGGCLLVIGLVAALFLRPTESPSGRKPPENEEGLPGLTQPPANEAAEKADQAWRGRVAAVPAKKQVEMVAARLKELNPG